MAKDKEQKTTQPTASRRPERLKKAEKYLRDSGKIEDLPDAEPPGKSIAKNDRKK